MALYIARHGQDEDNAEGLLNGRRDRPLTANGIRQAEELAQHLKTRGFSFAKIFSSPLQRAYKTAETIADALENEKPEKIDLLIERDFGVMSGQRVQDIEKLCAPDIIKTQTITYFLSPEGAETFSVLLERAKKALTFFRENTVKEDNVLLVTHGDFGKMLYAAFYEHDWMEMLTKFHFGNSELLLLDRNSDPAERHIFKQTQFNH